MKKVFFLLAVFSLAAIGQIQAKEGRILRFPTASETHAAFCHAGDVYVVPLEGGLARKITNSPGEELFPRFSRDGSQLAFTAEYDGNREIYVMPAQGGEPTRITFAPDMPGMDNRERMGPDKVIMQWTPGDDKILYRGRMESWTPLVGKLYYAPLDIGLPEEVPLPKGGFSSLSPDGSKIAYNRIYREFRTWKRYRGGQADDIWIYDFKTKELTNISNNPAQDIIPVWHGNKIYYLSDRDKTMNIFCYNTDAKATTKITDFTEYDVKFPSYGSKYIAFENAGYLYILDPATDEYRKIDVEIRGDFPDARPEWVDVKDKVHSYEISPAGNFALFTARGDIFAVPAEKGKTYNFTKSSGVHDRAAVYSPDGKKIAWISDESGEDEIYIMNSDGTGKKQLTKDAESYRYQLEWSPDSKKILCSDKALKLYYYDVETGKRTDVARSKYWEFNEFVWSPDSRWIAYTDFSRPYMPIVNIYSTESGKSQTVVDDFFQSSSPEFSSCGKYLFFASDRTFRHREGNFERSYTYNDMAKIYGITLQDDVESPFAYETDEIETEDDDKKSDKSDVEIITIDFENIKDRIFEFPVEAGNYRALKFVDGNLYYVKGKTGERPAFYVFDLKKREESQVSDFAGYEISADGKMIIYRKGPNYYINKLRDKIATDGKPLDMSGLEMYLDKKAEWAQIFDEAWRQMKYFFYDPDMHQVDWEATGEKYRALLPYVEHRTDLTYILGEMISELNVGHAYVGGGERPEVEDVPVGLLGAKFEKSGDGYKITKIYEGQNWDENTRSPLTEPGIDVNEGDFIVEIDGVEIEGSTTPYAALVNKAEKYVTIKVNSKASLDGAREYTIKTIASESGLAYFDWVEHNRKYVEEKTDGKIGYVHIPDMMPQGLNQFVKYWYPQLEKEGMIIDDRYNGGGNVSPMVIERLARELTLVGHARNQQVITTHPDATFTGPLVCLINDQSMSDGDMFPYQFKRLGLGELIGTRTWGGVIGIRGSLPFLDGGYMMKPEFSHFTPEGDRTLEGYGVDPDIEVDNHPAKVMEGVDQQLDKAIEVVLEKIENNPKTQVPDELPPYPDKR